MSKRIIINQTVIWRSHSQSHNRFFFCLCILQIVRFVFKFRRAIAINLGERRARVRVWLYPEVFIMVKRRGMWHTPNEEAKNLAEVYTKLERNTLPLEKIDLTKEMTYFNNQKSTGVVAAYDHFFAYTKMFPLFDPRKLRCNRAYLPDIWENIYQQEKNKPVAVTTALNYGRRVQYDFNIGTHRRRNHISNFYRRRGGTVSTTDDERYSEDLPDAKL